MDCGVQTLSTNARRDAHPAVDRRAGGYDQFIALLARQAEDLRDHAEDDTVDLLLDDEVDLAEQSVEIQIARVIERRGKDGKHTGRNVNHLSSC